MYMTISCHVDLKYGSKDFWIFLTIKVIASSKPKNLMANIAMFVQSQVTTKLCQSANTGKILDTVHPIIVTVCSSRPL